MNAQRRGVCSTGTRYLHSACRAANSFFPSKSVTKTSWFAITQFTGHPPMDRGLPLTSLPVLQLLPRGTVDFIGAGAFAYLVRDFEQLDISRCLAQLLIIAGRKEYANRLSPAGKQDGIILRFLEQSCKPVVCCGNGNVDHTTANCTFGIDIVHDNSPLALPILPGRTRRFAPTFPPISPSPARHHCRAT
jgi:hypothetical protein